jgi:hypothetical protein
MYARIKEDDVEEAFTKIGYELVKDVGRRFTGMGDKIMYSENTNTLLVIDNKSTVDTKTIRISKEQLDKIHKEAKKYNKDAIGVITITFHGSQKKYMILEIEEDFRRLQYGV